MPHAISTSFVGKPLEPGSVAASGPRQHLALARQGIGVLQGEEALGRGDEEATAGVHEVAHLTARNAELPEQLASLRIVHVEVAVQVAIEEAVSDDSWRAEGVRAAPDVRFAQARQSELG